MSDLVCITNRYLCRENFLERMEKIVREKPRAVILREKDMEEVEYEHLAEKVMALCHSFHIPCILHSFTDAALHLGADAIHLPLPLLRQMEEEAKAAFKEIGTSCHSVADVLEAEKLGCSYVIAGHIFPTDCKKGVPPRGLDFLREVCEATKLPVYAIGGINSENMAAVTQTGAKGGCIMSGFMTCPDVRAFMEGFRNE